ncbi:MarR family winged helix-turn-helix transcriptional regulator [Streptomyces sp. GTA36]
MKETRWLNPEELQAWRAYCNASALLEDALEQQLKRTAGIIHLHFTVLAHLCDSPDRRLRMTDLAERLAISRSRLTYVIRRLKEDGWVCREHCSVDKRTQYAVLTDNGMAALERIAPGRLRQQICKLEELRAADAEDLRQLREDNKALVGALH